ncbi:16S rRNA (cytosine(967)-C(5))-methyltransferase RsmB [Nitrogeniibacter aestuarii]|uniref:16S rRNA (cytosine(967)-C(5))-methyltransferase RsmB n=1 Tax=Nitrogeniibacter aestuarii TaxID=2815343 RepID=UPI001E2A9751|nr:16S rRNA (cytosine(967)-C(5))-methyltransferase RsmB [Nitrogeniibacter aestuarii]
MNQKPAPRRAVSRGGQSSRRPTSPRQPLPPDSLANSLSLAAQLVAAVIEGKALTEQLAQLRHGHPNPDINWGAVQDLTYGTLREYGRGDAMLAPLIQKPLPTLIHALLLVACHRLEHRPDQQHTVVDQAVNAAAFHAVGLKGVVNGVLRNLLRRIDELRAKADRDDAARLCHPDWWIKRLRRSYPNEWESVLAAGNMHPPMALRANRRHLTSRQAQARLAEAGIEARLLDNDALLLDAPCPVERIPGFFEGQFSVQDAGAQWAARWLAPRDGERILDACAAPGGKTAHILELADARVTALELDPKRARRIEENLSRIGATAEIKIADCVELDRWWDGQPFDRILADVPCSASGVVRRHPDIKWLRRNTDIPAFAAQQAKILDALWQTLAPGGTMLYVTCSVFEEENRTQIARFCTRHADAKRMMIDNRIERIVLPNADHDGFYYALLRKDG